MAQDKWGRLSSFDLLPEEATPDIVWANDAIKARRMPQIKILDELNRRLADRGIGPISKSAFNRKVLSAMANGAALLRVREMASVLGEKMDEFPDGDVGLLLNEMGKAILYDVMSHAQLTDKISMGLVVNSAIALEKFANARKHDTATRDKNFKSFTARANAAVDRAGAERGLSTATIEDIKAQILGVAKEARAHA
jgi:hypothetical protein